MILILTRVPNGGNPRINAMEAAPGSGAASLSGHGVAGHQHLMRDVYFHPIVVIIRIDSNFIIYP
jgi:hypothetical protein